MTEDKQFSMLNNLIQLKREDNKIARPTPPLALYLIIRYCMHSGRQAIFNIEEFDPTEREDDKIARPTSRLMTIKHCIIG